jgi:hypothetical protein
MRRLLDLDHLACGAVSYRLGPAGRASEADLRAAQERERLLTAELPRVREAATAWRNGLGGLLIALVGFGLIKGRTDVSQLAGSWAAWVGILLLAALIAGAAGALLLIRAANGRPSAVPAHKLRSRSAADHIEADAAARALRRGIALTLCCAALLVAAVGATWYGPGLDKPVHKPVLQITNPSGTFCGSVVGLSHDNLTLKTAAGEVTTDLEEASAVQALARCPAP